MFGCVCTTINMTSPSVTYTPPSSPLSKHIQPRKQYIRMQDILNAFEGVNMTQSYYEQVYRAEHQAEMVVVGHKIF